MSKPTDKKKARRKKRKANAQSKSPKTDASQARRTPCTDACADTCQAEYEAMLSLMGEIEAIGGNVSFVNSHTGESWGDGSEEEIPALANLGVCVSANNVPVVWVRQTRNGPDINFDGDAILKMAKRGEPGETRLGIAVEPLMGDVPFHISLKSTHPDSLGSTVLEVCRSRRTSWFDWSPERMEAIRERASAGDYSDGTGRLVLTFGDIRDAIFASDIPCVDEPKVS